jgi:hypothetical protein
MPEFRVVIDGRLSAEQEHSINRAIQHAVLPQLAAFDDDVPCGVYIPHRRWLGLVARQLPEEVAKQEFPELRG